MSDLPLSGPPRRPTPANILHKRLAVAGLNDKMVEPPACHCEGCAHQLKEIDDRLRALTRRVLTWSSVAEWNTTMQHLIRLGRWRPSEPASQGIDDLSWVSDSLLEELDGIWDNYRTTGVLGMSLEELLTPRTVPGRITRTPEPKRKLEVRSTFSWEDAEFAQGHHRAEKRPKLLLD
ncbi:hypothetical protein BD626DRAFT_567967 [Schizophyllum amplum]|uniref:Uncharacterized protein n=1 Tax=Schizophyllum amplum TaxID=97359 RepID=A0A550CJZ5_9AGAR|nr:hypothetical protein BD626DRAFT_567967 [Auriculariopsis ampla]